MATTLSEFLHEKAAKEAPRRQRSLEVIAEWRAAVEALIDQMKAWIGEADPQGSLETALSEETLKEESLGAYKVPKLEIYGFTRVVSVVPKARYTVATAQLPYMTAPQRALGRVDLMDAVSQFMLLRFRGESGDLWMLDDVRRQPRPFGRAEFEAALMSMLQ